jgi:NADPH-dependent curcumin reductase CurA
MCPNRRWFSGFAFWRTHALLTAADARRITQPAGVALSAFLGVLGGTGLTADVGLTRIARLQPGEDLYARAVPRTPNR